MQLRQAADDRLPKTEIVAMWFVVAIAVGAVFWNKLDEAMVSTDNIMRGGPIARRRCRRRPPGVRPPRAPPLCRES
jgi:hypothetical protein